MRGFTVCSIVGFALLSFATITPALSASISAPADEYFGHYHMSILGIRNAINGLTIRAHDHPESASSLMSSVALTEDAIRQWQAKYPNDSWLPKTVFSLERLYVTIGTAESAELAVKTAAWLDHSFSQTIYAKMGHTELASLSTSDDGNLSTADSPASLGMIPALSEGSVSVAAAEANTAVPPSADAQPARLAAAAPVANLPSFAYSPGTVPPAITAPHPVDIVVKP